MLVKGDTLFKILNSLVNELPQGWIAKSDKLSDQIAIYGPDDAVIFIKSNKKSKTSVIGKWPESSSGQIMDPYEWGVLNFNDDYPFMRLCILQSTESNINKILKYISDYKSIYNECLNRHTLQQHLN